MLDSLVTNYDLKVVAIEGSAGYIDTSILKTAPDETIRKKLAQGLMSQGRMSAGEFFAITSTKPIALYGIEDKPLYRQNVEEFRKIYELNRSVKNDIFGLENTLKELKEKAYSDDLKALEANSVLHQDGKITFNERWSLVNRVASKSGLDYKKYANLTKLTESLKLEKSIDFDKANKERDRLVDLLSRSLTKQDLEQLVLKSLAFKTNKISQGEYYIFLQSLANNNSVDPAPYSNLIRYTEYSTLYESIDLVAIFEEVRNYEDEAEEALFTNDYQRKLHEFSRCVSFIKGLFEVKLANGDFEYLEKSVSVMVSVYNGEKTLGRCLRSIVAQDYPRSGYEVIVIDDASRDGTPAIAKKYADLVIAHHSNLGLSLSRSDGIKASKGSIIVNIDSDVLIESNTLARIVDYFSDHIDVSAVTGLLSRHHPNPNFLSQYKNLYMNYIFMRLPEEITFLYGSIHAFRREVARLYNPDTDIGEDTMFGQELVSRGKKIALMKDLEVIHLKRYAPAVFIKNDFEISFNWAKIFLKYKGWKQLGKNRTGYAHSPKEQLLSVALAPAIILLTFAATTNGSFLCPVTAAFVVWFFLNRNFLWHLGREKGTVFGMLAIPVTFLDNVIMALGITCGFCTFSFAVLFSPHFFFSNR